MNQCMCVCVYVPICMSLKVFQTKFSQLITLVMLCCKMKSIVRDIDVFYRNMKHIEFSDEYMSACVCVLRISLYIL